jgi:hypothetical protein
MLRAGALPVYSAKIRGWLLPIGVGVALCPLWLLVFLTDNLVPIFATDAWSLLTTPGSPAYHPLNGPVLLFELLGNAILLACSLVLAVLFFQRRRRFPILAVSLLVGAVMFYVADYFAARQLPGADTQEAPESLLDLGGALLLCAVLSPYFLVSKRVKATFVR